MNTTKEITVVGTGSYAPAQVVSNRALAESFNFLKKNIEANKSAEKIISFQKGGGIASGEVKLYSVPGHSGASSALNQGNRRDKGET